MEQKYIEKNTDKLKCNLHGSYEDVTATSCSKHLNVGVAVCCVCLHGWRSIHAQYNNF